MLKKYRKFTGLFLIFLAAALLFVWEVKGRDMILMQDVCVAKTEIRAGQVLSGDMLRKVSVPRNAMVSGVILPQNESAAIGKRSVALIPAGAQISKWLLDAGAPRPAAGTASFVIDGSWIFMRSSSLRAGDQVEIFTNDGLKSFGTFNISYVKDQNDGEVRNVAGGGLNLSNQNRDDRTEATAQIDHIEIETVLPIYLEVKSYAENISGPALLLVRR